MLLPMKQNGTAGLLPLPPAAWGPLWAPRSMALAVNTIVWPWNSPTLFLSPGFSWSDVAAFGISGSQHGAGDQEGSGTPF